MMQIEEAMQISLFSSRSVERKLEKAEQPIIQAAPFFFILLVGASVSSPFVASAQSESSPVSAPSEAPSNSASPVPLSLSAPQRIQLELEFKQALQVEVRALNHQISSEWKALKSSQRSREREWKSREKSARREFFNSTTKGSEKTKWMEDRKKRYQEFKADLFEEQKRVKAEQGLRKTQLQEDQKGRSARFQESLQQGLMPDAALWHPTRQAPAVPTPEPSSGDS